MKKIIVTIITCGIVVLGFAFVTRSETMYNMFAKNVDIEETTIANIDVTNTTYWYNKLNDDEKKIYRIISKGVSNLDKNITVEVMRENNFSNVKNSIEIALSAFFADNPDVFYIKETYEISMVDALVCKIVQLKLKYISNDKSEIERMKTELDREIEKINGQLAYCKTDFEKELLAHDILAREIQYFEHENYDEIPNIKHTAYSALVEKSAVCDGITKAFQIILSKSNIDSIFVTGMSEGEAHAWCKVKLDGEYYNVDVTSDKALNKENSDLVIHSYFNVTDKEISVTHSFGNYDKLPKSEDSKYNYYTYNDYVITYMDGFEYKLNQIIQKQNNANLLEFKAKGITDIPSKMVSALYNLNFNNYKSRNITAVEYNQINDNYIVVK